MQPDEILIASDIHKSYAQGNTILEVLAGVDLRVTPGERVAIVGLSGSGKSTLLHMLGGLDEPDSGQIWIAGRELSKLSEAEKCRLRNQSLGFVYQFHHLLEEFTAIENVAMPLLIGRKSKGEAMQQAREILSATGLEKRLDHRPSQLSGGERQRVAIARAMVTHPSCVLADEPTGNLDEATADKVNELMIKLSDEFGVSFIIVTHNNELAARMDRCLRLHNGRLESGS